MIKKSYLFLTLLTAFLWLGSGTMRGATLTVADGTATNAEIPVYGWYADTGFKNQFIYSASLLSDIAEGSTITGISFYSATSTLIVGTTAKIVVRFAEVANETFSSAAYLSPTAPATFVEVYNGNFNTLTTSGSDKLLVLDFGENTYTYNGGNLLVEVQLNPKGSNCPNSSFYGVSATGNGLSGFGGTYANKYIRNFLPKATITYTPSAPITCAKPTDLTRTALGATSATFTWTDGGSSTTNLQYKSSGDWNLVENVTSPYVLSGLTPETAYEVQVQSDCGSTDGQSAWTASNSFTTCIAVPWSENFESQTANAVPSGWSTSGSTSTTASQADKPAIWNVYSYSSNKMIRMYNYWAQSGVALINTPIIELPAAPAACELTFDYAHTASCGVFYVKVSTNNGVSFTNLNSYDKTTSGTDKDNPGSFTEATIDLTDYAGERIILQFYANANYGSGSIFVDNISVHAISACSKPTGLSYDNVTASSVDLSWTAGASETAWNVRYMADGDADWTVIPADDNDGFTVSGLSDNTHYTMQVQADCGNDVVSEFNVTPVDFTTKCNAFTMPFAQNFNDLTAGIPDCWDNSEGTTEEAAYKWNYNASGYNGACVRFEALYNPTDKDNYLKTPSITVSEAAILSFRYKNPKGAALSVYYAIDGGSKTVLQSSFDTKTSWSDKVEIDLSADWVGHNVEFFFRGVSNCSYGDAYIYLDEVQVKAVPTCITPTGLGYSAVTAEGATLSWTAGASETAWKVQYSEDNSSWSEAVDATSNPFVLTGLDDNTLYYVRVAANCGESVSDYTSATVSFTTKCAAITSFPWSEDFQGETNETNIVCWDNSASTCFTNPAGSTPSKYVWGVIRTGSYGDYNYQLYMRNFNVRAGTALINTPSFTLPSDKDMQLVFNYSHLANCDPLVVKISQNGGAFAAIDGASYSNDPAGSYSYSSPGTYKEATIDLSAYRGKTITLQFFTTANFGEGAIWLDNVKIEQAPSCFKPQNLSAASSITPDGATFTWTASGHGESTYQWAVAAGSDAPVWEDNAAHKTSELSKAVSGLAAGTYKFYVRSYCDSEDQSDAAVSASFTTATVAAPTIGTITTTNNSANASWTAPSVSFPVQYQWSTNGSSWSDATSNLYADINDLDANSSYTFYVRSYYDATHIGLPVSKAFKTACDPFTVAVGTPFVQNFNELSSAGQIPDCWNNDEVTLPNPYASTPTAARKWSYYATGYSGKCVRYDSYNVSNGVVNVFTSPIIILNTDADLSFYAKNPKGGDYKVQISVNGGERADLVTGLTNLSSWTKKEAPLTYSAGTKIQLFFVGTSNAAGGDAYLYLDEVEITPVSCRKPASDPVESAVTGTEATLTWTAGGTNTDYQFALALKDESPVWDENNVVTALTTSFDKLTPLTWYDFYVRTYCDESNQSDARKVTFRTDCAGFVTLPFNENFNGVAVDAIPDCWNNDGGTSEDYYKWKGVTYSGRNTSNCVRFNSSTNAADATNILATPLIKLGEGNLLTFWAKNPTGGAFKVQIKEEGEDAVDLLTTGLTGLADWTLKYAAIPAAYNNKKVQLLFHATSNDGDANAYIYIDDVRVARGEAFVDGDNTGVETRLSGLNNQTIDFIMTRQMQYNGYYNTLCLPFNVSAEDMADSDHPFYNSTVKAFDYAVVTDELQLAIIPVDAIEAGVPYFVRYNGAATADKTALLFKEVTISASAPGSKEDGGVTYQGIFNTITAQVTTNEDQPSCLFVGGQNALYWPTTAKKMNAFRAYFSITYGGGGAGAPIRRGMPARLVEHADAPTGVDNVQGDNVQSIKVLENDQVVIIRNGVKYSIQGQKIQ